MNIPAHLFDTFSSWISETDIDLALPYVQPFQLEKEALLLQKGEICSTLFFLTKGVVWNARKVDGKDKVVHVFFEGEFCTALYSFYSRTPSEVNIKALTSIEGYRMDYESVQLLYNQSKNWERVGRLFAERSLIAVIRNRYDIQHKDAYHRYHELISQRPQLLQLLSLGQIADILGIKQETLSRIRAKK